MTSIPTSMTPTGVAIPSLRLNFAWTLVGNVVYAACQWAMLIVLAKVGTPEMVGRLALGLAVVTPVMMLGNLQLRSVQATDAIGRYRFADYLSLRLITMVLALLVIGGLALAGYRGETVFVILLLALSKSLEAVSDVFYGLLQQHERMDRIAKSMLVKGPVALLAFTGGVLLTGRVWGGVIGLVIGAAVVLAMYDIRNGVTLLRETAPPGVSRDALRPHGHLPTLAALAWMALPLGIVMMLSSLSTNLPRIFVERYHGEAQLGLLAALAYLITAGTTVVSALGQSSSPRLAKQIAAGDFAAFRHLLFRLLAIGVGLGIAGVLIALLAGKPLLTLIYTAAYAQVDVFVWVMASAALLYVSSFLGAAITAMRQFQGQAVIHLINIGIIWVLGGMLIPHYALRGAAWTMCISAAFLLTVYSLMAIMCYRKIKGQFHGD